VDGSFSAHGRFDDRSIKKDWFFEFTKYIPFNYLLLGLVLAIVLIIIAVLC
jgi:hypothetical protein